MGPWDPLSLGRVGEAAREREVGCEEGAGHVGWAPPHDPQIPEIEICPASAEQHVEHMADSRPEFVQKMIIKSR